MTGMAEQVQATRSATTAEEVLSGLGRRLADARGPQEILAVSVAAAMDALGAAGASAVILELAGQQEAATSEVGRVPPASLRRPWQRQALSTAKSSPLLEVASGDGIWRAIVAPILLGENVGVVVGAYFLAPATLDERMQALLAMVANYALVALAHDARSRQVEQIVEASHDFAGSLDVSSIVRKLADQLRLVTQAESCTVYRWDQARERLVVAAASGTTVVTEGTAQTLAALPQYQRVLETGGPAILLGRVQEEEARAILPISTRDDVYGLVLLVFADRSQAESQHWQPVSTAIIDQASLALEGAHLFQDTLQRELFFAALGRVTLAINASVDLPTVLNLICQESMSLFEADGAYIWQIDQRNLIALAARGHSDEAVVGSVTPLSDISLFPNLVAKTGQGTYRNSFQNESGLRLSMPKQELVQAVLGIPLEMEAEIIGVLVLVDTSGNRNFRQMDVEQATLFGVQAAIAIRNARLVTELRAFNEQLDERVAERTSALGLERDRVQYLLRVTSELSASLDQHRVLFRALQIINEIVQATHGTILLVDAENGRLAHPPAYDTHRLPPMPAVDLGKHAEQGIAGWIVRHREPVIINNTVADDRCEYVARKLKLRSVLGLPLIAGDEVIGVLLLFHRETGAFSDQQLELVEAAAMQIANAVGNAQLFLLIRDQAERLGRMLREEHIEAAKNQAILESIADGVLVAAADGRVILSNLAASLILELDRSKLQGKRLNQLLGLYGSSAEEWLATIDRWANSSETVELRPYLSERLTIEDKVVSVRLSPVFARDQFFGTVSIFRDVTKEVEVDRMKSEFVSTVSHELRTPMTSIKGYAELMLMGASGQLSPTQSRYLSIIRNNANRMTSLVNDLLDISRIEAGKTELEIQPVDLSQIIEQQISSHLKGRMKHEGKRLKFATDIPADLPLVEADFARITQVLTNLVDNAFHYTPPEGHITISARAEGEQVRIRVRDTGIGIAADELDKIFERFYRSENVLVQKTPGTGLGLAIVRSLVEMHGGSIEVESEPDEGSTFTVTLPLVSPVSNRMLRSAP